MHSALARETHRYWIALARLIYPETCVFCKAILEIDERLACSSCLQKIPLLKPPLCKTCAMTLPPYGQTHSRCASCRRLTVYFDAGTALFCYRDEVKTLLHEVKFSKKPWYLKVLRPFFQNAKTPLPLASYDFLVPIPLDQERKREREFNQSDTIARLLGIPRTLPPIRPLLAKVRQTEPQSVLDRSKRLTNLEGAFRLARGVSVSGKSILLVDDVVTTGATVNECAKCLKQHGANRVDFFSLARAVPS